MDNVISRSNVIYTKPQNVILDNIEYKDIYSSDTRHYIEKGQNKSVTYMNSKNSKYVSYMTGDKVDLSIEYYSKPKTKVISGKTIEHIYSSRYTPTNGTTVYETISPALNVEKICVGKNGEILNLKSLNKKTIGKCIGKICDKLVTLFHG